MDEGKPAGPKPKWWSRPRAQDARAAAAPEHRRRPPRTEDHGARPRRRSPRAGDGTDAEAGPHQPPDGRRQRVAPARPSRCTAPTRTAPRPTAARALGARAARAAARADPGARHARTAPAPPTPRAAPRTGRGRPARSRRARRPQGTHVPHPHATGAAAASPAPPGAGPQPRTSSPWLRYDPWGAPGQPLSHPGRPVKTRSAGADPARRRGPARPGRGRRRRRASARTSSATAASTTSSCRRPPPRRRRPRPRTASPASPPARCPAWSPCMSSGGGEQGTGTGFVLDERGHILTNNHVVDPAGDGGDISVTFSGGETAKAEVVGRDSGYDLAVVKVSGVSGLKPLPLGNSDNVQVGDPVVAIGAPFDLARTPSPPASSAPRSGPSPRAARRATAATSATSTRCRPTPRSTPATPAARWSTPRAGSSASTAPSGPPTAAPGRRAAARPAASAWASRSRSTRASASPRS